MSKASGPLAGYRILLVEDSYPQAMDTSEWLTEAGAEIVGPVPDADKAEILLAASSVDAAVLDINLGMGADYEIAANLRDRGVPFILATGYDKSAIDTRFHDAPHLSKPLSQEKLLRALSNLL